MLLDLIPELISPIANPRRWHFLTVYLVCKFTNLKQHELPFLWQEITGGIVFLSLHHELGSRENFSAAVIFFPTSRKAHCQATHSQKADWEAGIFFHLIVCFQQIHLIPGSGHSCKLLQSLHWLGTHCNSPVQNTRKTWKLATGARNKNRITSHSKHHRETNWKLVSEPMCE